MLRCVCGKKIGGVGDLEFSRVADGVIKARCGNKFCRLEEVAEIELSDASVEVKFSAMFSDYNLLSMGSDMLEQRLKHFGCKIVDMFSGGKSLKTRVTYR